MARRATLGFLMVVLGAAAACSGDKGDAGATGPAGPAGSPGATGGTGATGAAGAGGATGGSGAPGANGDSGAPGKQGPPGATADASTGGPATVYDPAASYTTKTQVKHLVVVFGENISFDHYFGTYPHAANPDAAEPRSRRRRARPRPTTLQTPLDVNTSTFPAIASPTLLTANPNANGWGNGTNASNPFRLASMQAETADMGHNYTAGAAGVRQRRDGPLPAKTGTRRLGRLLHAATDAPHGSADEGARHGLLRRQHVSTFWSYAQNYALNDNSWTTTFGPSTPGAINLISGQTNGSSMPTRPRSSTSHVVADGNGGYDDDRRHLIRSTTSAPRAATRRC